MATLILLLRINLPDFSEWDCFIIFWSDLYSLLISRFESNNHIIIGIILEEIRFMIYRTFIDRSLFILVLI